MYVLAKLLYIFQTIQIKTTTSFQRALTRSTFVPHIAPDCKRILAKI